MDGVCGKNNWDVAIFFQDMNIQGVWPYFKKKKYGLDYLTQPPLTPYLGPLIIIPDQISKTVSIISFQKKVLHSLANDLPQVLLQISHGDPSFDNWQPLSWKGYHQTTRYTYRINLTRSLRELSKAISDKTRNSLVHAKPKVTIRKTSDAEEIYSLVTSSFSRQKKPVPFSFDFFKNLDIILSRHEARMAYVAYSENQPVALAYVISDMKTSYLLLTGRTDDDPGGAAGLLIWKSIEESKKQGKTTFDFEGSMIESVESFFRSFGGEQTAYHKLIRTPNKWIFLLMKLLNRF